jgi:hypothetical protein
MLNNSNFNTALQTGGSIADLIVSGAQKQKQAQLQQQLDLEKAKQMLPIEAQGEQQKADIGMSAIKKMQDMGLVNEGGGASALGVGVTRGIDPSKMANQQDKLLNSEAMQLQKLTKPIQDNADVLEQIRTINELAKSPNAYDQKNMAVLQARIAEGKGQRLLQNVIQSFNSQGQSAPGWAVNMVNKVSGGAAATITPEEMRQLAEHTQKMSGEYKQRFNDSISQYDQMAPTVANRTMAVNPATVNTIRDAASKRGLDAIKTLDTTAQQYQNTALGAGRQVPSPAQPQEQGLGAWLKGKLGIGGQQSKPAMSFEDWKKANGR